MMRFLWFILFLVISTSVVSQSNAYEGPRLIYSNQFYVGGHLATSGWGAQGYLGKYDGYYNMKLMGFEIVKLKNPREKKVSNGRDNSRRYTYGKLNSFQSIRVFYGKKKIISDKLRHGAVALGYKFLLGPSLGFLKPIYVELTDPNSFGSGSVERYDPSIHDLNAVRGRANFLNGLNKISFVPGAAVKASIFFEYSGEDSGIQQLETGISIDLFPNEVAIMTEEAGNQQFFPSIFLSYSLGKKYVKR